MLSCQIHVLFDRKNRFTFQEISITDYILHNKWNILLKNALMKFSFGYRHTNFLDRVSRNQYVLLIMSAGVRLGAFRRMFAEFIIKFSDHRGSTASQVMLNWAWRSSISSDRWVWSRALDKGFSLEKEPLDISRVHRTSLLLLITKSHRRYWSSSEIMPSIRSLSRDEQLFYRKPFHSRNGLFSLKYIQLNFGRLWTKWGILSLMCVPDFMLFSQVHMLDYPVPTVSIVNISLIYHCWKKRLFTHRKCAMLL
jgi:hypothetical protein